MVANLNRDAGYTNATAFFSSKLIVDNKGGSIYVWSEAEYGKTNECHLSSRISLRSYGLLSY